MSDIPITQEDILRAQDTVLGSKLFTQRIAIDGIPTPVYGTAIPMRTEEFREDYKGGFYDLKTTYRLLTAHMRERFFTFGDASAVNNYAVFSFFASREWQSLREQTEPLPAEQAVAVFRMLLEILSEYRSCPINSNGYRPLLFLCRDSVFLHRDRNGMPDELCLLPLPLDAHTAYAGMPHTMPDASPSADVYMAAYLYLDLKYPHGKPFAEDAFAAVDRLAERCLSPFAQRRPSAEELLEALAPSSDGDASEEKPTTPHPRYAFADDEDDEEYDEEEHKPSLFGKVLPNKKKQAAFGVMGKLSDTVGALFSDEQESD